MAHEKNMEKDVESRRPARISHFKRVIDQSIITDDILHAHYHGSGTQEDPYSVVWLDDDPVNPMNYAASKKWFITALVAISTLVSNPPLCPIPCLVNIW